MSDAGTTNPDVQYFFWGDAANAPGLTLDQLKARRAVAAAMASKARPYPTTVGQGLTALGEGLGQGLYERNLGIAEARQHALDVKEYKRSQTPAEPASPANPAASGATSDVGSPSTNNEAVADSGPDIRDSMTSTILARQGLLPGSAPLERTRMAALDTGTVSDAGSPGLTYGGAPAGPGASMMEPPTTAPPAPTAPSVAANAAAQQPAGPAGTPVPGVVGGGQGSGGPAGPPAPVGADAVAGSVLAQIGAGAPVPKRAPPPPAPPPGPLPMPGQTYAPATTNVPPTGQPLPGAAYPAPGETREVAPTPPGEIRPPPVRQDTPAMIQNRAVRNDPRMLGRRSESVLQQMDREYSDMKEARDKAFERQTEQWQKDRDTIIEQRKKFQEDTRQFPQRQQEAAKREMEITRMRRFGSTENANNIDKATMESAQKVEPLTRTMTMIPELNGMVDKMFSGAMAGDKLAIMKTLNSLDRTVLGPFFGNKGYFNSEIEATEAFKSAISSVVASTLKSTVGSQGVSNADREYAERAAAGDINMEPGSIKRILDITRRMGINSVREHNDRMDKVYDDPQRADASMHRMFKVQLPDEAFDPTDVMMLRISPNTQQDIAAFNRKYGNGTAERILQSSNPGRF